MLTTPLEADFSRLPVKLHCFVYGRSYGKERPKVTWYLHDPLPSVRAEDTPLATSAYVSPLPRFSLNSWSRRALRTGV